MNNELYRKISRFEWLLRRKQINGTTKFDPNRGQGRILTTLKMKDGISTKDLSYILGIAVASLNEMLGKLVKAGLVERKPSEQDKRIMLVYLTAKGKAEISSRPEEDDIDFLGCLSDEEQKNLENYLDRMIQYLEEALGEKSEDFAEHMKKIYEERERIFGNDFPKGFGGFGGFGGRFPEDIGAKFGRMGGTPKDLRGKAPEGMPGAERFSPDYDGPVPNRDEPFPFSWDMQDKKNEENE